MWIGDRLSRLLEQCESLPGKLDRREAVLAEMKSLGCRIDAAYLSFGKSPQAKTDLDLLRRTQSETQAQIEHLRREADAIMAQWWEVHRAVGTWLIEAARRAPALLPALETFSRLPTPSNSNPKLQVLRLRELLRSAQQLSAPAPPAITPKESKEAQGAGGLVSAKDIAATLGISDKTVYRLARQGRIPYVRIHSSLRFRLKDIEAWVESKSFRPAGMKKADPAKKAVPGTASSR